MPHDRNGQKLEVGDRVRIPVRPIRYVQVEPNPDFPSEYTPQLVVQDGTPEYLEGLGDPGSYLVGVVKTIYPQEDACNANFAIEGVAGEWMFNTRLVEKVTA